MEGWPGKTAPPTVPTIYGACVEKQANMELTCPNTFSRTTPYQQRKTANIAQTGFGTRRPRRAMLAHFPPVPSLTALN